MSICLSLTSEQQGGGLKRAGEQDVFTGSEGIWRSHFLLTLPAHILPPVQA